VRLRGTGSERKGRGTGSERKGRGIGECGENERKRVGIVRGDVERRRGVEESIHLINQTATSTALQDDT
jgi:hypothetical protein